MLMRTSKYRVWFYVTGKTKIFVLGGSVGFMKTTKAVLTDSHFLVPFTVLIAGIVLLIVLH